MENIKYDELAAMKKEMDEATRLIRLLDGLCAWLLHRFGPDSPEGREAEFRQKSAVGWLFPAPLSKALGKDAP